MKNFVKFLSIFLLFQILLLKTYAQIEEDNFNIHRKNTIVNNNPQADFSTGNTGTGSNMDVKYHRCEWTADPDDVTKTLIGKVTTYFSTTSSNVSTVSFDFNNTSFNNSFLNVKYHGINCTYSFPSTGNVDIINVTLPSTIIISGTLDSLTINYKGIPPAASGSTVGYQRKVDGASNNYIYTLSESYEDKDWWPCKADMQDKIDSLDIIVTAPNAFWVAANGVMIDSSIIGANRVCTFKHRYPIASYLVAIAIGKYNRYNLGTVVVGSKNVPFILNIFQGKSGATETSILNVMNNNKLVLTAFNNLFGDYPFANEKHGFYEFGFSGGMEHQTFSGIGGGSLQSNSILAHELAHQWWGDKATFSTWNHLWLAEGFATYSEVLAAEFVPSLGLNPISKLASVKSSARSNTSSSIYLNNIASSNTIWTSSNTTMIYNRGCMVASMLRALLGDTKYFNACKNYLNNVNIAYKSAITNDLQTQMENQFGESISGFFDEWINKKGTPDYTIGWGNNGNTINISLSQSITSSGTGVTASTHFPMPVILTISNGTIDTTVVIYHKSPNQLMYSGAGVGSVVNGNIISYQLSFVPTSVVFDTQNKTMATATVSYNAALPINNLKLDGSEKNNQYQFLLNVNSSNDIDSVELQKSVDAVNFESESLMRLEQKSNNYYNFSYTRIKSKETFYRAKLFSINKFYFSNLVKFSNDIKEKEVKVYPNPAKNSIQINYENVNNLTYSIKLVNLYGKVLQENLTNKNTCSFNISTYAKGVYFIQLVKENKMVTSTKFIISK